MSKNGGNDAQTEIILEMYKILKNMDKRIELLENELDVLRYNRLVNEKKKKSRKSRFNIL